MKNLLRPLALATALAFLAPAARASSPFEVYITAGPAISPAGYGSFPDLLNELLNANGHFSGLNGNNFTANLTFLGVTNAIITSSNATGTNVNLSLPITGFNHTFSGATRAEVENQIEDFFLQNGSGVVGDFLAAIAKQSAVAVTDGNPNSSTAQQSDSSFYSQGFTPASELAFDEAAMSAAEAAGGPGSTSSSRFQGYGIGFNSGRFKAGALKGEVSDLSLPFGYRFTERVSISGSLGVNYLTLDDAKIYGVGLNLGVPIRIEIMNKENPWNWRLTPLLGISARGSKELAGGGVIWMAGLTNTVDYRINSKLIVGLVNQITTHQSMAVDYGSTKFDPKIDQQITKNGLRAVTPLTSRLLGDVFVIQTNFLQDAAVDSFTTYGGSLSFRLTQKFNVTLGGNYDTGANYESWSVGLSSAWRF